MARARAALVLAAAAALGLLLLSGDRRSDPRTPPALPGLPPPFMTAAVLGDGGLAAGLDAYGDVVDLRPEPAGPALIDDPLARQRAGTVPAETGIVPHASVAGATPMPFWRASAVRQRYMGIRSGVLRTTARFPGGTAWTECAASGARLGCIAGGSRDVRVGFARHDEAGGRVDLQDGAARRLLAAAARKGRRWLGRARPLGRGAPGWARRLYERSLLVLRSLTGRLSGAVAAGARDGWAYVWPRDAGAAALALASAGYRGEARRIALFLRRIELGAAARFEAGGESVAGRPAQGDAWGWAAAAARASGLPPPAAGPSDWRGLSDYQEKGPGDYLGNALASGAPAGEFAAAGDGLAREAGSLGSGLDSAAAWAVRPFARPRLFARAHAALDRLLARAGPYGLVPSEDWPDSAPWTAPTAWSAWSLAVLGDRARALALMADLRRAATPAGLLPERVGARTGVPLSTAPLAWSHAFAVLAIRALWPRYAAQLSR